MFDHVNPEPMQKGYYLVRESDGVRFFIGPYASMRYLDKVCDKVLSDKHGWDYWIDFYHGLDIEGRPYWSNIDQVEAFDE